MSATSEIGGAEKVLLSLARFLNPEEFELVLLVQTLGPLSKGFQKFGHEVVLFQLPAWRKTRNLFKRYHALKQLIQWARTKNFILMHCNTYRLAPYMVEAMRQLQIPGIVHLHDRLEDKQIKAFSLAKVSKILAVSDYVREPFLRYPVASQTIHNGIFVTNTVAAGDTFKKSFAIPKGSWVIGMIANFTENKRPTRFIEIAGQIKMLHPNVRFVIVGHNAWNSNITAETLRTAAAQHGVKAELILTGWRDDVAQILQSFDALVVPSLTESFPLVVLEAMAAGVVVFAHEAAGGPREQIRHGEDGFLVDCERPEVVAEKIVSVLNQPVLHKAVQAQAQRRAETEFAIGPFIRRIEDFYRALDFRALKKIP